MNVTQNADTNAYVRAAQQFSASGTNQYYGIDISTGHASAFDIVLSDNEIYATEYSGNKIVKMDKNGQNKSTFFSSTSQPLGMVFDSSGNLYIAEHSGRRIIKIDPSGNSSILLDTGTLLTGITIDSNDNLFALDYQNGNVLKMNSDGTNKEIFCSGFSNVSIIGLTIDSNDNLYVSSRSPQSVFKVAPDGTKSDFITNTGSINEVKIGKDGFLYVPNPNTRTIDKFDLNGNKLDSFNANSSNIWAIEVDTDGSIYFSDGSYIRRIIGYANTVNTKEIKLTLNKNLVDGPADPYAFMLSGAASAPQITSAVVIGNEITLTLDTGITAFDTALKLSYFKTGTNDLTIVENGMKFSNFGNMPVSNGILSVVSVADIPQINVKNGTSLNEIPLPTEVTLNISDYSTITAPVTWDNGSPEYNRGEEGIYSFTGTFEITDDNLSNPNEVKAHVEVDVEKKPRKSSDNDDDSLSSSTDKVTGIKAEGTLYQEITVSPLTDTKTDQRNAVVDPATYNQLKESIDNGYTIIDAYEITCNNHSGELKTTIPVGEQFDGKEFVVKYKTNKGSIHTYTGVVKDGEAVIVVPSLSKLMVAVEPEPVDTESVNTETVNLDIQQWKNPFADVNEKDWFYESAAHAYELNLMQGTSSNTFEPSVNATRGMIVSVLYNQAGKPEIKTDDTVWYAKSRAWAMEQGISDGRNMQESITREQLVTMLWRSAKEPMLADYEGLNSFHDAADISAYAKRAMMWAHEKDIINGKGDGMLDPKGNATRAEVAAMVIKYRNLISK